MKLTSVEIHPANSSNYASLSFRDLSRENPYNVKEILGLDADAIIPRYYGGSGTTKFYDLSLEKRDIVISIELNPRFNRNETFSDLRDSLYKMISSSRTGRLQLQFKNGEEVVAGIFGFTSKFETAHFEKTQEIKLTVNCDEPMLKSPTPVAVRVDDLDPAYTNIQDNKSNAPHGFKFSIAVTANIPSIKITDPGDSSWSFEVVPVSGFLNGEVIHLSSEYNDKYLRKNYAPLVTSLAELITPGSIWPLIFPGNNRFSFTNPTSLRWNLISYYPTYWGV